MPLDQAVTKLGIKFKMFIIKNNILIIPTINLSHMEMKHKSEQNI